MKIETENLNKFFTKIIEKLNQNGYKKIDTDFDYYWNITTDERFSFEKPNPQVSVGSLSDDISGLERMIENDISTLLDIERFANIMLAISQVIHESDKPYNC